ncbi:hypothetical protein Q0Z83_089620 [Actinoplanes sichuanensis]|nr:hypothetical protein Q0Z83_089620 [Actinoplanes sichuanensis]
MHLDSHRYIAGVQTSGEFENTGDRRTADPVHLTPAAVQLLTFAVIVIAGITLEREGAKRHGNLVIEQDPHHVILLPRNGYAMVNPLFPRWAREVRALRKAEYPTPSHDRASSHLS